VTLDELMEKMAGQRRTNVTQATKEAFDADKAYREYKQKQKEQKERQAANEKAMRNAEAEQRRKNLQQEQYSKYGLIASPTRKASGIKYIDSVNAENNSEIDTSILDASIPQNLLPGSERNLSSDEKLRLEYNSAISQSKNRGMSNEDILKTLGDFEQYKARKESPENTILPENLLDRAKATRKWLDAVEESEGKNLSSLLMSLSAYDDLAMDAMGATQEQKKAVAALNSVKGQAGIEGAVQGFRLNMPLVSLFDDFSSSSAARNRAMDAMSEWGVPVYQNTPRSIMSKEKNEPLTANEINEIIASGNTRAIAAMQLAGLDLSQGSRDMELMGAAGIGNTVGNVAAEIAEYAILSAFTAPAAEASVASKVTSSLSKGAKFFANHPKLTAYLGKAAGDFVTDNTLDTALSVSGDLMRGEDAQTIATNALLNTAINAAGSLIMPIIPALSRNGRSALQESYDAATGAVKRSTTSLSEALSGSTREAAAENLSGTGNIANRIIEAADRVDDIPDELKSLYSDSVRRQVDDLGGMAEFNDALIDSIDYEARVEAAYRNVIETINTRVRNQYGDEAADQIMSEMGDALQSEAAFSDYLVRLYGDGGVFDEKSAQDYFNSTASNIKDKESYQKWLDSIEDSRWVSSYEVNSSDGYMDYVDNKLYSVFKNDPSMAAVVDLSQSEPKIKHQFVNSVILAADEVTDLPQGVGAAEEGFTRSMKKADVDAIREAENPIEKVAESIGAESAIVNASRSVSDAPLDATVTIGEGDFAKTMTGREYVDRIKNSPFMPRDPQAMNAHMEAINRDIARATLMQDNESLTISLLQLQAAKEVALTMDYDEYLKANGNLSSFIQSILGTSDVQSTPELLDAVSGLEPRYLPRQRAEQIEAAQKMLSKSNGAASLYDRLYDQDTILTDNDVIAAKLMADRLRADGQYDEAAKIYELIQQKARASGRAVEALKFFQDTPEMMVYKARKIVEQAAGKKVTAALDDLSKAAHQADNAAVKEKVESVANQIDREVNAIYQAQDKAIKEVANDIDNAVNRSQNSARALLNRITAAAKKSGNTSRMTRDDILTTRMVNDLFSIARKSTDPEIASRVAQMDRWEFARAALDDRHTYRSVWNEARALAQQQYANDPEMLRTLETWTRQWLDETDALDQTVAPLLTQALKEQGFKLSDFIDPNLSGDKIRVFAQGVVDKLGLVGADADNVTEYIIRKVQSRLDQPMQNLRSALENGDVTDQTLNRVISDALLARGTTMRRIMEEYYAGDQAGDLVEYIVKQSGLSGDNANRLREMLRERIYSNMESIRAKEMEKLFKSSKSVNTIKSRNGTTNLFRKKSTSAEKTINLVLAGGKDADYRRAIASVYNVPDLTEDQATRIMEHAQKLQGLDRNSEQYNRLFNEILSIASEGTYMDGADAFAAWMKTMMLSNPQTHITNIVGNAAGVGVQRINNAYGVLAERLLRVSPDQSTHRIGWAMGEAGKAREAAIEKSWDDVAQFEYSKTGRWIDPRKTTNGRYDRIFRGSNIATRGLNKYSGTISNLLSKEDMGFAKQFYRQAAGSMMAAQGVETVTKEIQERALNEAMFYTFHNSNALSKLLNQAKRIPGAGKILDLTMLPFVGTTVDIFKQSVVDYNPVVAAIRTAKKMRGGNIVDAVDIAAKGLTGLSAYILGGILFSMGVIKLNDASSAGAALDRASREDDFSIQIGPVSMHVGNLQPYMIPVMQGAAIAQAAQDISSESDEDNKWPTILQNTLSSWAGVAMDNSMWSSVENILISRDGSVQAGDVAGRMVENFAGSLVPAGLGAIANSADNTVRASSGETFVENGLNRFLSRLPGYTYTKEALIDMWGNEVVDTGVSGIGGTVLDALNAMVNPLDINVDPYADDALTNEVERLYELGFSRAVPSTPDDTLDFDGKTYTMTDAEYADMCREIGQLRYTRANNLIGTSMFQARDDEKKADALARIYSTASTEVRDRWKAKLAKNLDKE
jgi:hypothetical protein